MFFQKNKLNKLFFSTYNSKTTYKSLELVYLNFLSQFLKKLFHLYYLCKVNISLELNKVYLNIFLYPKLLTFLEKSTKTKNNLIVLKKRPQQLTRLLTKHSQILEIKSTSNKPSLLLNLTSILDERTILFIKNNISNNFSIESLLKTNKTILRKILKTKYNKFNNDLNQPVKLNNKIITSFLTQLNLPYLNTIFTTLRKSKIELSNKQIFEKLSDRQQENLRKILYLQYKIISSNNKTKNTFKKSLKNSKINQLIWLKYYYFLIKNNNNVSLNNYLKLWLLKFIRISNLLVEQNTSLNFDNLFTSTYIIKNTDKIKIRKSRLSLQYPPLKQQFVNNYLIPVSKQNDNLYNKYFLLFKKKYFTFSNFSSNYLLNFKKIKFVFYNNFIFLKYVFDLKKVINLYLMFIQLLTKSVFSKLTSYKKSFVLKNIFISFILENFLLHLNFIWYFYINRNFIYLKSSFSDFSNFIKFYYSFKDKLINLIAILKYFYNKQVIYITINYYTLLSLILGDTKKHTNLITHYPYSLKDTDYNNFLKTPLYYEFSRVFLLICFKPEYLNVLEQYLQTNYSLVRHQQQFISQLKFILTKLLNNKNYFALLQHLKGVKIVIKGRIKGKRKPTRKKKSIITWGKFSNNQTLIPNKVQIFYKKFTLFHLRNGTYGFKIWLCYENNLSS